MKCWLAKRRGHCFFSCDAFLLNDDKTIFIAAQNLSLLSKPWSLSYKYASEYLASPPFCRDDFITIWALYLRVTIAMTTVMSDCRSFLYICRNWVQQPHSCNPHPFLSAAWTRSLNLSLTPEEKNPSPRSPERLSLQTKTKSMGGQSHILILGQRTWIWYEAGNSPIDCRVSPRSMLSFNGPPPARQSHIKKMLNCKFQTSAVDWRHIIGMGERRQVLNCSQAGQMDTTA